MFYVYCFVCTIFFSGSLFRDILGDTDFGKVSSLEDGTADDSRLHFSATHRLSTSLSSLDALPMANRFAKQSAIQPLPKAFQPNLLHAQVDFAQITACLWTHYDHLRWLEPWLVRWEGMFRSQTFC